MTTPRAAYALLLLVLFGIGGVVAPVVHEIDHAQQDAHAWSCDGSAEGATLGEAPGPHAPCLCAVTLVAVSHADAPTTTGEQVTAWIAERPPFRAAALVPIRGDRGPPQQITRA
jgi:hypothetical protein